jgi:hypothetical protein
LSLLERKENESEEREIPIYTLQGEFSIKRMIQEKIIETGYHSKIGEYLKSIDSEKINLRGFPFPRWNYNIESEYTVKEIVDLTLSVINSAKSFSSYAEQLTTKSQLERKFVIAKQIHEALVAKNNLISINMLNNHGGFEMIGKIKSLSTPENNEYVIAISVMKGDDNEPKIYEYCSCPLHSSTNEHFVCKHFLSALSLFLPEILGTIDYIKFNNPNKNTGTPYEFINNIKKALTNLNQNKKDGLEEGLVYYVTKFLVNSGYIEKVLIPEEKRGEFEKIVSEALNKKIDSRLIEKERKILKPSEVEIPLTKLKKIVWPDEMKKMKEKIRTMIDDLDKRFGIENNSEWSTLLTFASVMGSDYTEPPIVLHAVGEIGTFKTTGASFLSNYVEIPEIVISINGDNIASKYYELIKTISQSLSIPQANIENSVGGIITSLKVLPNMLTLTLNKTFIYSIARKNNVNVNDFINELRQRGFNVEERSSRPKIGVIDPAQLGNIEDYRYKIMPNDVIGLIRESDVFDNNVVIIDEGSRNPKGLETLLTKMSISSVSEGVRIIIITDNLEPFQEVITNPRYAPLHDRTYKAFTNAMKNEVSLFENFNKTPAVKFKQTELLATKIFIDSIPVPEELLFLAKMFGYALSYKFSIGNIDGIKYLQIFDRNTEIPIEIDAFNGKKFTFVPGGRFVQHTLTLAKFFAFLNNHEIVTPEDLKNALMITVKSRLVTELDKYIDYRRFIIDIYNQINEIMEKRTPIIEDIGTLAVAIQKNDTNLPTLFQKLLEHTIGHNKNTTTPNNGPILAPAIASIIEIQLTKNLNIKEMPENIQYTAAEILLQKGDFFTLQKYADIVSKITKEREKIIHE